MARLKIEGVRKSFGDVHVVKGFDQEIEDGGFVVLVGPSGCGKSTMLRMIAGLETPTAGRIFIGERDVTQLSPRDRDAAMVFQSYALYPHMTVYDNISFGLRLRKMPKAEIDQRVQEAAAILGLGDYLLRKPKQLSGGQRQRVAMGRAIVRKPSVFLFDEPLSNLDAKLRVQMRVEIAKLHQKLGVTTVYVTHDQVEAMTLAKTIVVMNDGLVQQAGAPLDVYRTPANTFVAGFVGSPAMNFFPCVAEARGDAHVAVGRGFVVPVPAHLVQHLGAMGRELLLGVRPEHLVEAPGAAGAVFGAVDVLEPLGAEVHALGHLEGQPFTAKLSPETQVRIGENVALAIDHAHVHLFDRRTGIALGRVAPESRP